VASPAPQSHLLLHQAVRIKTSAKQAKLYKSLLSQNPDTKAAQLVKIVFTIL